VVGEVAGGLPKAVADFGLIADWPNFNILPFSGLAFSGSHQQLAQGRAIARQQLRMIGEWQRNEPAAG
jgi:hypothetical protein